MNDKMSQNVKNESFWKRGIKCMKENCMCILPNKLYDPVKSFYRNHLNTNDAKSFWSVFHLNITYKRRTKWTLDVFCFKIIFIHIFSILQITFNFDICTDDFYTPRIYCRLTFWELQSTRDRDSMVGGNMASFFLWNLFLSQSINSCIPCLRGHRCLH